MAETQLATTGKKSQVWIEDAPGANTYTQLKHVKRFGMPKPEREKLESTHLESEGKEYVPGDVDFGDFDIVTNYRPGSDTDERLEELAVGEDTIGIILIVAIRGTLTKQYSGDINVLQYGPDEINRAVNEAVASVSSTGAFTSAAYTTPPPVAP